MVSLILTKYNVRFTYIIIIIVIILNKSLFPLNKKNHEILICIKWYVYIITHKERHIKTIIFILHNN